MRAIVGAMLVVALLVVLGCGKESTKETSAAGENASVTSPEQKLCPVMERAIKKSIYVDHEGRRIYFCCPMCIDKFKADPAKYIAIVDAELSGSPAAKPSGSGHEGHEGH